MHGLGTNQRSKFDQKTCIKILPKIVKINPENFFCTMCWRPRSAVKKQSKLCYLHATDDDSREYKRRRRRLEKLASERNLSANIDDVVPKLCTMIKSPNSLSKNLEQILELDTQDWSYISKKILYLSEPYYKLTFSATQDISLERFSSPLKWAELLIRRFDKLSPSVACDDYAKLSEGLTCVEQRRNLFHLFARLEAEHKFSIDASIKRGPKLASRISNLELYSELIQAIDDNRTRNIQIKISQIARRYKLSKQAIYEKIVRVKANLEHYRKHIKKHNKTKKKH